MIIILKKINLTRYSDALLDSSLFVFVMIIFSGSFAGMTVAMLSSFVISLYLFVNPPTFFERKLKESGVDITEVWNEIKSFDPSKPPKRFK